MAANPLNNAPTDDQVLRLTRTFDAPVDLVWRVWTEPAHLSQWWGPHHFTVHAIEMDLREGGSWSAYIESAAGDVFRHEGEFEEVVENERLVFTHEWVYEDGRRSIFTTIAVDFRVVGPTKTEVAMRQEVFDTVLNRDNHMGGWGECFDDLGRYISTLVAA